MNISSILITIIGIIIILGLYVASRVGQTNLPKKEPSKLPEIKDDEGELFTSVLDDIPASDSSMPDNTLTSAASSVSDKKKKQIVLFISSKDDQGLDGNLIKKSLLQNNLQLGDKDIYHYLVENNQQTNSLFRIANGVEPWTLTDNDLMNKKILGISLVMLLPAVLDRKDAITLFMKTADEITLQLNGILKNQQQETLTTKDRELIFSN